MTTDRVVNHPLRIEEPVYPATPKRKSRKTIYGTSFLDNGDRSQASMQVEMKNFKPICCEQIVRMLRNVHTPSVAFRDVLPVYFVHYKSNNKGGFNTRAQNARELIEEMADHGIVTCEYDIADQLASVSLGPRADELFPAEVEA